MEQFVLVPASVFNESVTTQSITQQEFPKFKAEQYPTYQINSLKIDINKKLFGKADTLIDKILSCSRMKLSNLQIKILDGVDTGLLIAHFFLHLPRKILDVPDISFTLLHVAGISPSLFSTRMPKLKIEEARSTSKYESQKLQRRYTQGAAAYGSIRNFAKASRLPVPKVRQFLHSKDSFTKFTLATRKFIRLRAFARIRNEIWCLDFAHVDELAQDNNGVKYLLVHHDLFDRTVYAKGMKTKDSQETVKAFSSMITKKDRPGKIWIDKGTEFALAFEKFSAAERIQIYSTMSETKVAFAERTTRSLKNFFTVTWKFMDTSIYTNYLNLSLH